MGTELLFEKMRILLRGEDDVGSGADVGGHGGLGAQILPALAVDLDVDARGLGEPLGVRDPEGFVALDELGGTQDA
jgi:hypothetical protein